MELKICHLYPDVLNLYGDRGNIACMRQRLAWRGIDCSVTELPLGMKDDLAHRYMNEGFSGGEKKRNEIVQMKLLKPDLAMLDEIDSGLDIDALKIVADNINEMHETGGMAAVIVSHYERFLEYLKPQFVHVLVDGRIVAQGGYELVEKIDAEGYEWLKAQNVEFRKEEAPVRVSLGSCAVNQKGRKNGNG